MSNISLDLLEEKFKQVLSGISTEGFNIESCYIIAKLLFLSSGEIPLHKEILHQMSIIAFLKKDYELSFNMSIESYKFKWDENNLKRLRAQQHNCIGHIIENWDNSKSDSNIREMTEILDENRRKPKLKKMITVTMTTCKRLDLFIKTVTSFLDCCKDKSLIDEWIVVDDNSSQSDKLEMQHMFPFIKFIFKSVDEKGHAKSMNILKNLVETPLVFHMEDDWFFFRKEFILNTCIDILSSNENYGQCLLNREYGERSQCYDIYGKDALYTSNNTRFYEHFYLQGDELKKFSEENKIKNCVYWPHYSLRPGMMKTSVWKDIGSYNEDSPHFEMEYAQRYSGKYKTAFMDNLYCWHLGRCTFERFDPNKHNAYTLNNERQFGIETNVQNDNIKHVVTKLLKKVSTSSDIELKLNKDEENIPEDNYGIKEYDCEYRMSAIVLNLERRKDRLKKFIIKNHDKLEKLNYKIYNAVDGENLVPLPKILKLFETGDYNYRKGIMGCALSHICNWLNLITNTEIDCLMVFEDDVELADDFAEKVTIALKRLPPKEWDILFLGHFLYPQYRKNSDRSEQLPIPTKWTKEECIKTSMGGAIGYIINKAGALKMLHHIRQYGMYNAIDWLMFKNDLCNIYYCYPHIVYSECLTEDIHPDSDIQYNFKVLCTDKNMCYSLYLDFFLSVLNQKEIYYYDKEKCIERSAIKNWESIFLKEHSEKSKIAVCSILPNRDILLTKICFIMECDANYIREITKQLPITSCTIFDAFITIPNNKINKHIADNVILDNNYLHINKPI